MACKCFAFEEFFEVVRKANEVEFGFATAPVDASRVHVAMDDAVLVQMLQRARQLAEDEQDLALAESCFAKLFPQGNVVWTLSAEQK
jgi:hypothetical protein